jgi:SAM-dependent methyltransferase
VQVLSSGPIPVDEWDEHWGSFGEAAENSPANQYRTRLILSTLGQLSAGERVLDVGSGQGELALAIATRNPDVLVRGLEYSEVGVEQSRTRAEELGVKAEFEQRDLLYDRAPESELRWADSAVCSEVLEHLDDPVTFLRRVSLYLKPGCAVVVTVPAGPRSAFDRHIGHRRHYNPQALWSVLDNAGFDQIRIRRAGFPFFNLYRLVVVARGRGLIADLDRSSPTSSSLGRRVALSTTFRIFDLLFHLNFHDSPFGWQLVAEARVRT